jgi:hypothetical protein
MNKPDVSKIVPVFDTVAAAPLLGVKPGTLEVWRFKGIGPRFVKCGSPVVYRLRHQRLPRPADAQEHRRSRPRRVAVMSHRRPHGRRPRSGAADLGANCAALGRLGARARPRPAGRW